MKKLLWLLPAALILTFIAVIPNSVGAQDTLKVGTLTIVPESKSVKEGETVTITAEVSNTGDTEETYTLDLKVNDEVKDTKTITLQGKANQTVSFDVTAGKPGDYIVDLGGQTDYFTVQTSFIAMFPPYLWVIIGAIVGVLVLFIIVLVAMPPGKKQPGRATKATKAGRRARPVATATQTPAYGPLPGSGPIAGPGQMATPPRMPTPMQTHTQPPMQTGAQHAFPTPGPMAVPHPAAAGRPMFQMRNLAITPNQLKQGDPVTISAIVSNNGTEHGKYSVVLRIGGVVEGITEVDLAPGTSQSAVFTVVKDIPGTYYAEVDGLAGSFLVIALTPAYFTVKDLAVIPDRVKQEENITVSAIVTNTGEVAGNHSLVLKIKGVVEAVEEVSLEPGASQRVAFDVIKDMPGFYQVDLEGLTGRFVVEMEWRG
jgi:hypothetical protein